MDPDSPYLNFGVLVNNAGKVFILLKKNKKASILKQFALVCPAGKANYAGEIFVVVKSDRSRQFLLHYVDPMAVS